MAAKQRVDAAPSTLVALVAGSVGGACQVLVGQPLDTIKTRSQIAPVGMFTGPKDVLLSTLRKEGFFALYKGMMSPLIGVAGVNSLLFASYHASKRIISPLPNLSVSQIALAGAMAGAVNSLLASPVEMFKIKMQGQYGESSDKRLSRVFNDMWKEWGFRKGIMRGFWITVVREVPAYAGFYAGFEGTKRHFQKQLHTNEIPIWATLTSGAVGGIGYWTFCYPLDVVKSRIQMADKPPKGANYIFDTFRQIYREEGPRAFIRGLSPTYIRAVPAAASTFAGFELARQFLQKNTNW